MPSIKTPLVTSTAMSWQHRGTHITRHRSSPRATDHPNAPFATQSKPDAQYGLSTLSSQQADENPSGCATATGARLPTWGLRVTGLAEALGSFYSGRRVLVTGHTGFKGSWLTLWLKKMGALTAGIALPQESKLSLFHAADLAGPEDQLVDIRELEPLRKAIAGFQPEIVLHLAAQAIVGTSYQDPVGTFDTNIMGTVNVLECVRTLPGIQAAVMVTSDKCYENVEQIWGYREHDPLGGSDPYSASKGGSEIVTVSYSRSFFQSEGTPNVASARAGNVVGGGDWSELRLVPDCIRAIRQDVPVVLRNPYSTRPWQHVLEPLAGYLFLAMRLVEEGKRFQGAWNFGPLVDNTSTVDRGARAILEAWGKGTVEHGPKEGFHEATLLQLDCTKARRHLGWKPVLDFDATMQKTTTWYKHQSETNDGPMKDFSIGQLEAYEQLLDQHVIV